LELFPGERVLFGCGIDLFRSDWNGNHRANFRVFDPLDFLAEVSVSGGLLRRGGDADRPEFPRAVQADQFLGVPRVGLDLLAGAPLRIWRTGRRKGFVASSAERLHLVRDPAQLRAGRPRQQPHGGDGGLMHVKRDVCDMLSYGRLLRVRPLPLVG
jgi:hypothetical protein